MTTMIPPGYRFVPTDEELITSYLLKKSMGLPLPWNQISERDIYGENVDPWDVLNDDVQWDDHYSSDKKKIKKVTYVFTRLKSRINGKTRIGRRTRSGTWKGQTTGKEIKKGSDLIGLLKAFTFQETNCKKGEEEHDRWTMNEYSLAGICLKNFELKYKDYVICKISRTISNDNENQPHPIIIPQLQANPNPNSDEANPNSDEDIQLLADEIEQAMTILPEENQFPIIPHEQCGPISYEDAQLLANEIEQAMGILPKENQEEPIIPREQCHPDEDDQLLIPNEVMTFFPEENQAPVIPQQQLLADEKEQAMTRLPEENRASFIPQQFLLKYNHIIGRKRSAQEIFEEESSWKMQKKLTATDLDDLIHFGFDDISSVMKLREMAACSSLYERFMMNV